MGVKATAYRLKANKTKLYAFAKQYYPNIEPMKKTEFIKYAVLFSIRRHCRNQRSCIIVCRNKSAV